MLGLLVLAIALGGCSCRTEAPRTNARDNERWLVEETDALGGTLRLKAYPRRIVTTAPSNTDLILQLGCRDRLVGVSNYYGYPELVEGIARAGTFDQPSLETILALKPDLVLVARGIRMEILERMRGFELPVFCLDTVSMEDLYRDLATVGRLLGVEDRATTLVERMRGEIGAITETLADLDERARPRVFWLAQEEPIKTAGPGNLVDTMITLAGGRNIAADARGDWIDYSLETLLVKDPEVILVCADMGSGRVPNDEEVLHRLRADPTWSQIAAVSTGRVHVVPTDLIGQPTPRVVDGLRLLARLFHPELFIE
ncbi:MAG: ABC transporter substrate-binding protein [Verrucomicrobia bacterium]|nr:ABC transporter substrate-binding protein [Verrucomicrobiota bacterium]